MIAFLFRLPARELAPEALDTPITPKPRPSYEPGEDAILDHCRDEATVVPFPEGRG